ncbi:cbb3-type cytochrome c oxidase subunit I, partial [Myxococcota bacterium]|nr:cbb3-type cytochrome c oxidase subunit I [Myxococcota bacterium]
LYYLIPRLFGRTSMYSTELINLHFWLSTIGVIFYVVNMWIAGVMQGLMWRAVNEDGTLTNTFVQSLEATRPFYLGRLAGGSVFLLGMLVMAYNTWRTISASRQGASANVVAMPAGGRA